MTWVLGLDLVSDVNWVKYLHTFTLQCQPFLYLRGGFLMYTSTSWAFYPPVKDFLIFWQWLTGRPFGRRWLHWLQSQLNPAFELFSQLGSWALVSRWSSPSTEELSLPPLSGPESVLLSGSWPIQQPCSILKVTGWSSVSIVLSKPLYIHVKLVQIGSFICPWFC